MTATTDPFEARARQELGLGCDQVRLDGLTPLAQAAVECDTRALGVDTGVQWELCRSRRELEQTLRSDLNLGVGLGPLPLFQAKQAIVNRLHVTTFSLSLVVKAHQTRRYAAVRARPVVAVPSSPQELERFVRLFGDAFVGGCAVGGEFFGIYTLYAQSQQQARQVHAMFQAGIGIRGVTLTPSLLDEVSRISREAKVNVSFRHHVSGLSHPPTVTRENLLTEVRRFPSLPLDNPQVVDIEARGYETLPEMPAEFEAVAANRRIFTGDPRIATPGLLHQQQRLMEVRNQMDWVEGTYTSYAIPQDPALATAKAALDTDLQAIQQLLQSHLAAPTQPLQPPSLRALEMGTPSLNLDICDHEKEGIFPKNLRMGGDDGAPFGYPFADIEAAVAARVRLSAVGFHAGDRVAEFRVSYERDSGSLEALERTAEVRGHRDGGTDPDLRWSLGETTLSGSFGNARWRDQGTLRLPPLARGVTRIEAKTGTMVDRLFLSSDGQRIGGGSDAGDRPVDWSPPERGVVLGFAGRAGRDLDALWPIVAVFLPLRWEPVL